MFQDKTHLVLPRVLCLENMVGEEGREKRKIILSDHRCWHNCTDVTTGFNGVDSVKKMSRKMQVIACKSTLLSINV